MLAELLLVAFVYLIGILYVWPQYIALDVATWYATPVDGGRVGAFSAAQQHAGWKGNAAHQR